jgi:hypothetical protein
MGIVIHQQQKRRNMYMSPTNFAQNILKSGLAIALMGALCIIGSQTAEAQNPANGIEASGLEVSENARIVRVEPDNFPLEVGNLNRAIESELTGEDVIFELHRDAVYWTDSRIENPDYRLHIRAEAGDGHRPIIRSAVDLGESHSPIYATRDFILEGLYFLGINEDGVPERILEQVGESAVYVFDDGVLNGNHDIHVWMRGSNNYFYFTNSIIKHAGRTTEGSGAQGRFIDTRGNDQELIYIENCTIYNLLAAIVRNSGATIRRFYMNHNTAYHQTLYIRVGQVVDMEITNNLFVNLFTVGVSVTEQIAAIIELHDFLVDEQSLVVRNNNIGYLGEEFMELIAMANEHSDVERAKAPNVSRSFESRVTFENNIEEGVAFADPPPPESFVDWTYNNISISYDAMQLRPGWGTPMGWDRYDETSESPAPGHYTEALLRDFSYSVEHASFTHAENGFPLGDLNWFPELKQAWVLTGVLPTSVEEPVDLITEFRIVGNYPNPFNPTTNIVYDLGASVDVTMQVYNVLGQKVASMDLGRQSQGRHEVTFDASRLSSGIYVVRMQMGSEIQTLRMSLVK